MHFLGHNKMNGLFMHKHYKITLSGEYKAYVRRSKIWYQSLKSLNNFAHSDNNRYICKSFRGNSSVGRAQPCQGWGREFESRFPLKRSPGGGMVDALVSGTNVSNDVQVRVLFWAQKDGGGEKKMTEI